MRTRYHMILIINLLLFGHIQSTLAAGQFRFERTTPIEQQQELLEFADRESNILIERMNRLLNIPKDIVFVYGAEDGPLYDSESNQVWMPDEFTLEVRQRFVDAKYVETDEQLFEVTMDVIEHTLYHELGHALIDILEIPITGKEEDAVDNLATVLVMLTNPAGAEIVLSAADLFDLEGADVTELVEEDFWGEHSLDYQRFYNMICLIYGSQPEQYQYLVEELDIAPDRADLCIEDYARMSKSWKTLLRPHVKDKRLLN